jgi:hypothetical protein
MTLEEKLKYAKARYSMALMMEDYAEGNKWADSIYELEDEIEDEKYMEATERKEQDDTKD